MSLISLLISLPLLMGVGGCPQFQDDVVAAFETLAHSILDSGVTLYFDQFRSSQQ